MNCKVCGSNGWINSVLIETPDKYEEWMGITNIKRRWRKCLGCGLWHHWRNYPLEDLEKIYTDGYRHFDFRGETIEEAFKRIITLTYEQSENIRRVEWLVDHVDDAKSVLDIGSGLGVFPHEMSWGGFKIWCTESNDISRAFIKELGFTCTKNIPDEKFDLVSMIHVLEHIEEPIEFLVELHKNMNDDGKLFIEVPDAVEFERMLPTHDDFNSCHTHFYDVPTLYKVLGRADYNVVDIHREHYKERDLHRIMAICQR